MCIYKVILEQIGAKSNEILNLIKELKVIIGAS